VHTAKAMKEIEQSANVARHSAASGSAAIENFQLRCKKARAPVWTVRLRKSVRIPKKACNQYSKRIVPAITALARVLRFLAS